MTHQPYLRSHGYDPRGPGADERYASSYQRAIATITTVEPRLIEAWMRLEHPTLDGLSRDEFRDAVYAAIAAWREAGPAESEALAASFGL